MAQELSDRDLISRADGLVRCERRTQAVLLVIIGEIDRRRLYLGLAYPHMFAFCVGRWGYSRDAAYRRLHAARACRKYPEALSMIDDGSLQLSGLAALEPFLDEHGGSSLLEKAKGLGRRDVERLLAEMAPKPDVADTARIIPALNAAVASLEVSSRDAGPIVPQPMRPAVDRVSASSPQRVQFSFSGSEDLRRALERLRDLLRHKFPFARLEDLILEAARDYLDRHDPQRKLRLATQKPARPEETRRIPQWVRDRVWARDKGRCAFLAEDGKRCPETGALELDHVLPWSKGGRSDDPENIRLLCRAHNQHAARLSWGWKG